MRAFCRAARDAGRCESGRRGRFLSATKGREELSMVRINGKAEDADGRTLEAYLREHDYSLKRIAVERNGEIVPRARYAEVCLCDGDEIEIVSFVGGG